MLLFSTAITNIAYDDRLTSFVFQTEDREVTPTPTVYSSYDRADLYQQFSPNLSLPSTLADSPEDEYPTTADTSQQGSRDRSHPRYKRKSSALSSSKSPYSYDQGSHLSGSANLRNPFSPNTEFFASLLDSQNEFPSIVLPCSAWNDVTPLTITSDSRSSAGRESLFGQGNKDLTSEDAPFPAPQPSHYSDGKSNRISFAKAHGIEIQRDSWSAPDQSIFRKIKIGTQTVLFDNQSLEVRLKDIFNLCKMGGSKAQHYVLQHRLDYNVRQGGIGEFGRWVSWQTALQVCDNLDLSELKQQINLAVNASQQAAVANAPEVFRRHEQSEHHKCDKVNPSTGKPCNMVFTHTSNLTRHENTIHNIKKEIFRCQWCNKSYIRKDTLRRHIRSKHPDEL